MANNKPPAPDTNVKDNLPELMEELASSIAKKALETSTNFEDRLDAFKHLTAFYVGTNKLKPKSTEKQPGGFDAYRTHVDAAEAD